MQLPDHAIKELQKIYKSSFGVQMSDDKAKAEARRLLLFFYEYLLFAQNHRLKQQNVKSSKTSKDGWSQGK